MSRRQVAGAWALGALVTVGTAWLSRLPVAFAGADEALIRLSWRADGVPVEECERLTEEELARLPVHMRNPGACLGRLADFELRVSLAGREVLRDTVRASGARGDRPLFVFSDIPVIPGRHDVTVDFSALLPEGYDAGDRPTRYSWSGPVVVESAGIALITFDESGGELELRGSR